MATGRRGNGGLLVVGLPRFAMMSPDNRMQPTVQQRRFVSLLNDL